MTKFLSRRITALVKAILVSLMVLLINVSALAQKEANNWFFGGRAGLNFSSGTPIPLTESAMDTQAGSAVMSDQNGNLLFYTNGQTIWNNKHKEMLNGAISVSGQYPTQSAIIVPWPGTDCQKYFVLTLNMKNSVVDVTLNYSVVNMTLDGGSGGVETGNVMLKKQMAQKLAAVSDASGTGFWVIAHGFAGTLNDAANKEFYAYHITASGINTTPVVSTAGFAHESATQAGFPTIGQMKVSPDGKLIACAVNKAPGFVELLDFSTSTGEITGPAKKLEAGDLAFKNLTFYPYGLEFSPDGRLLYLSTWHDSPNKLVQFELATNKTTILYTKPAPANTFDTGSLQLGPDKKIYLAWNSTNYLGVIESPNIAGDGCQFKEMGPMLPTGSRSTAGLPAVIAGNWSCTGIQPNVACCQCANLDAVAGVPVPKGGGIYSLKPTLKAAPNKVSRVTATIISMTQTFPTASCGIVGPSNSYLTNASSPTDFNSYQSVASSNEVIWTAANSDGVELSDGRVFPFDIKLPPMPRPLKFTTLLSACSDSVSFCVKYTFTDVNCRTCEIIKCHTVNRKPNMGPTSFDPTRLTPPFTLSVTGWQPGKLVANQQFSVPLRVAVVDDAGRAVTDARGQVRLSLKPETGTPGAHLDGQTTVELVNGEATFNHLSIDKAGHGYVLTANGCDFPDAVETQPFDVLPARDESRSHRLERGMNEFGVWGGSSFNTPSQTDSMSHARLDAVGFRYGRILATSEHLALEYTFDALPLVRTSYPDFTFSTVLREDGIYRFRVEERRQTTSGMGLFPAGAQIYLRRQSRLNPFVSGGAGFIRFASPVPLFSDPRLATINHERDRLFLNSPPQLNDQRINSAYNFGGGLSYSVRSQHNLTLGYKRFYFSNVDCVPNSNTFTTNYFYTGYSFFK